MAYLQAQGCPEGQGYLFSRPVPAAEFVILLKAGTIVIPSCDQSQPEESLAVAATP
jgi:predicted signal transduction protein with EAL and GGDEF domain